MIKFRILSGDPDFRFELDARKRNTLINASDEGLGRACQEHLGSELDSQAAVKPAFTIGPPQIGHQIMSRHEVGGLPD